MNARGVGDSPQRPTQTAERQNLLLFVMVQDVAHPGEGLHLRRRRQRLSRRQLMVGFQVSIKCRFWVSTEGAKWLFLPKILGLTGFDVGAEPFQGFDAVIAARNELVHYKPAKEAYKGFDDPSFAKRLGLTFEACEHSIRTVRGMVAEFASQLREEEPWWFSLDSSHFFITSEKAKN